MKNTNRQGKVLWIEFECKNTDTIEFYLERNSHRLPTSSNLPDKVILPAVDREYEAKKAGFVTSAICDVCKCGLDEIQAELIYNSGRHDRPLCRLHYTD